jgi:membrane-bound acyltransferase YfiQ involved in biofilm formation
VAPFSKGAALGYTPIYLVISTGGVFWGGAGSSIWSIMLLLGAMFTIKYSRQPTSLEQRVAGVVVNALLAGFSVQGMIVYHMAYYAANSQQQQNNFTPYNVIRIVVIVLSGICLLRLYQVMLRTSSKGERFRSPLFHLLKKIVPYPVILTICQIRRDCVSMDIQG